MHSGGTLHVTLKVRYRARMIPQGTKMSQNHTTRSPQIPEGTTPDATASDVSIVKGLPRSEILIPASMMSTTTEEFIIAGGSAARPVPRWFVTQEMHRENEIPT